MITEADAHELALDFAGIEVGKDVKIEHRLNTNGEEAGFIVELTSDITIFVAEDGTCEYL